MTKQETAYYKALRGYWKQTAQRALEMAKDYARAKDAGIEFSWQGEDESPIDVFGNPSYYQCETCNKTFYDRSEVGYHDCRRYGKTAEMRVKFVDTGVYFNPESEYQSCLVTWSEPDKRDRAEYLNRSLGNRHYEPEVLASLGMIDGAHDKTGYQGYWFLVECELAGEALAELDRLGLNGDPEEEETLA